ncbi:hypothetical protein [Rhizobium sp. SGZ-381]|uniref:hypothetical protein n=1 Tax=Rhizobium sp. SGZ-381 TaxID=3342800 RepID=UPI003672792E
MQLIIGYTCVGVFVCTSIIAVLYLAGFMKIDPAHGTKLFNVLVVEIAVIGVGAFGGLIKLNPQPVATELAAGKQAEKELNTANETLTALDTKDTAANPTATIKPRVYIHIASENQRDAAAQAKNALQEAGDLVPGIQNVGTKAPGKLELRYFSARDAEGAKQVASTLKGAGISVEPKFVSGFSDSSIRPLHFELWFAKT